jgi:hypothetical protein
MTDSDPSEPIQISLGEMRFVPAPQELPPEPPAPAPPAPKKPNKSIPWKKIDDALVAVRTATLNGLLLVSVIAVVGLMATDLNRDVVVIDPIRLPEPLRKMGFSEDVAAHRLWDEVLRINEGTPTAKDRVAVLPASQRVDFEAPGAGISLQALVQMMRRFLGLEETRIAGEFICTTTDCKPESLALRLRVFRRGGMKVISMPVVGDQTGKTGIDRYFGDAARELLRELDPYVVAFHLYQTDKAAAEREALQIIGPGDAQRKWALNLLGLIAAHRGDHETAIGWYERAIAADAGNPFANSTRNMCLPTTTGETRSPTRAIWTGPSRNSPRQSRSTRRMCWPTIIGVLRFTQRATWMAPSPNTGKRPSSIRPSRTPITTGALR